MDKNRAANKAGNQAAERAAGLLDTKIDVKVVLCGLWTCMLIVFEGMLLLVITRVAWTWPRASPAQAAPALQ